MAALATDSNIARAAIWLMILIITAVLGFSVEAISGNTTSTRDNASDIRNIDTELHNHIEAANRMQTTLDAIDTKVTDIQIKQGGN